MRTRTYKLQDNPNWLPPALRIRPEEIRFKFRFTEAERRVYKRKKIIPVSQWAERYRRVTYGPLEGQKWDNNFAPHSKGIMDASFFPSVEVIGNCKAPQTGGSSAMETCIAYAADCKPGPALIVYPDKDTATKRSMDYFQAIFKQSSRLRGLLTGLQDDMAGLRIKLLTMLIYMGWAGSPTSIGNVSAKYLVLDEVDKYPPTPNKREAGTMALARKRTTVFKYGQKTWITSTPTMESGVIWQYLKNEAEVVFDYWVLCPDCGHFLLMKFDDIDFDGVRDPLVMDREQRARYACRECGSMWDDETRNKAARQGEWRARDDGRDMKTYLKEERPRKICFHTPAWISQSVRLSDVAVSFLKGQKSKADLKDFMTQFKAEPWTDYRQERQEENILVLKDGRKCEEVPGGGVVQALLAAVDTQDKGFWYEIRAWGWGENLESWQIREGKIPTFEALEQVLFQDTYKDSSGREYHVWKSCIDAMGHRTAEVYDFCRKHRGRILPIKGERKMPSPHSYTSIDRYPGSKKLMASTLLLYRIDTSHYKDSLASRLEIAPGDPGAWHLHSEATQAWCRQMTVEFVDEKGVWQCPAGKDNHAWDVSVYGLFLADFCRLKIRRKPDPGKKKVKKSPRTGKSKFMER